MFGCGFSSSKTKTALRLVHGRLSLLANKKAAHQKQLGSELAGLLSASKFDSARIRVRLVELVEGLLREERLVSAYEVLGLFLELLAQRLPVLEKAKELPSELREAVATILFMSARCYGELPELETIRSQLLAKTSRDFVRDACAETTAAATGVNGCVLELMSVAPPPASVKLERLERLSREAGIAWDADAVRSSIIVSVAPPDLVATEGQTAWGTPEPAVMTTSPQVHVAAAPSSGLVDGYLLVETPQAPYIPPMVPLPPLSPLGNGEEYTEYTSAADAARCAARSAEKAVSAAAAAARLASPSGEPACAASSSAPLGGVQEGAEVAGASAAQTQEEGESEDDLPDTPAASPAPVDTPAPPADDSDDLDALTKRFEALKRRM